MVAGTGERCRQQGQRPGCGRVGATLAGLMGPAWDGDDTPPRPARPPPGRCPRPAGPPAGPPRGRRLTVCASSILLPSRAPATATRDQSPAAPPRGRPQYAPGPTPGQGKIPQPPQPGPPRCLGT